MAEHDGKVVFDLEVDDSSVRGDVQRSLRDVERQLNAAKLKATVNVDGNTSAATTALKKVKSDAEDVENTDPTVTVDADTDAADTALDDTKGKAERIANVLVKNAWMGIVYKIRRESG